jgi:outer membrane protein
MLKQILPLSLTLLFAYSLSASKASAQIKIGTVEMNRVFQEYYKTKDSEARMNESRYAAKKEMDDRMEARNKLLEAINALNQDLDNKSLSQGVRDEKGKLRDDKIAEIRNLEREINEFKTSRERQLQEQAVRMRNAIVEDIMKVVNERVKTDGYDLLFDKTGNSLSGVPAVLFSKDSFDITTDIVTVLNKSKPAAPKAETRPAATPTK